MFRVRVQGLGEIERKLKALVAQVTKPAVLEEALVAGGEVIAEEARRLVPVRTGTLRDSIVVASGDLDASAVTLKHGLAKVQIGPDERGFYGHLVEFGTYRSAAKPFMRPAFDAKKAEAMEIVTEHLSRAFEQAARR